MTAWTIARLGAPLAAVLALASTALPAQGQAQPGGQVVYELLNRIERLEQEVRQLRGDMELYRYRQEAMERRLEGLGAAVPEAAPGVTTTPGATAPSPDRPPGAAAPSDETPATAPSTAVVPPGYPTEPGPSPAVVVPPPGAEAPADYEAALNLLREGRYEQAINAFRAFVGANPDSPQAGDAWYWLGEAYYVNRDYPSAREALLTVGTRYPRTAKMPDALLRLGHVYEELGEPAKARDVWQRLVEVYPDTEAAQLARRRL